MTIAEWVAAGMPGRVRIRYNRGRQHTTLMQFERRAGAYGDYGLIHMRTWLEDVTPAYELEAWLSPAEVLLDFGRKLCDDHDERGGGDS